MSENPLSRICLWVDSGTTGDTIELEPKMMSIVLTEEGRLVRSDQLGPTETKHEVFEVLAVPESKAVWVNTHRSKMLLTNDVSTTTMQLHVICGNSFRLRYFPHTITVVEVAHSGTTLVPHEETPDLPFEALEIEGTHVPSQEQPFEAIVYEEAPTETPPIRNYRPARAPEVWPSDRMMVGLIGTVLVLLVVVLRTIVNNMESRDLEPELATTRVEVTTPAQPAMEVDLPDYDTDTEPPEIVAIRWAPNASRPMEPIDKQPRANKLFTIPTSEQIDQPMLELVHVAPVVWQHRLRYYDGREFNDFAIVQPEGSLRLVRVEGIVRVPCPDKSGWCAQLQSGELLHPRCVRPEFDRATAQGACPAGRDLGPLL